MPSHPASDAPDHPPSAKSSRCGRITQNRCPVGASITHHVLTWHPPGAQRLQPRHLRLDVVGLDVEVHPALVLDLLDDHRRLPAGVTRST